MTQKEKLARAAQYALRMKNLARRLQWESDEYDCKWSRQYISEILQGAEELLKYIQGK